MKKFNSSAHINNLIDDPYYSKLLRLRSDISYVIDDFFRGIGAPKVDLYMVTSSVSSPMGKGSDSEPWPITMNGKETHLVDSAQFGMEPLVQNNFDMVYCYLPSFRGEEADEHHLSQFYHCEAELKGSIAECMKVVDDLLKKILAYLSTPEAKPLVNQRRLKMISEIANRQVKKISFDDACQLLNNDSRYISKTDFGRVINRSGELMIGELISEKPVLFWITNYDRDIVPFYQKPDPKNKERVLNADLILPRILGEGFTGEVLGAGQRQDDIDEINESIVRQHVEDPKSYEWYINMRQKEGYTPTSGFGMGIERLISWIMGTDDIASASLYPVLDNVTTEY